MEKTLERRLKREVERHGAKAYKFVSPGMAGVPDRLILIPGGRAIFVEMKDEGEKPDPLQVKRAKDLRALGFAVYCLDSVNAIHGFIEEVFGSEI
jgi:hypothetical protein